MWELSLRSKTKCSCQLLKSAVQSPHQQSTPVESLHILFLTIDRKQMLLFFWQDIMHHFKDVVSLCGVFLYIVSHLFQASFLKVVNCYCILLTDASTDIKIIPTFLHRTFRCFSDNVTEIKISTGCCKSLKVFKIGVTFSVYLHNVY